MLYLVLTSVNKYKSPNLIFCIHLHHVYVYSTFKFQFIVGVYVSLDLI